MTAVNLDSETTATTVVDDLASTRFIVFHRRSVEFLPPRQIAVQLAKQFETILVDGAVPWKRFRRAPLRRRLETGPDSLLAYSPYQLPSRFGFSGLTRPWNESRMRTEILRLCGETDDRYVIYDSAYQINLVGTFAERRSAYFVYDDFKVDIVGNSHQPEFAKLEPRMLERVDVVFAVSQLLVEECSRYNDNVVYLPNGFNADIFQPRTGNVTDDLSDDKAPVIGFAGVISGRVDFVGLYATAVARPHWRFVFLGSKSKSVQLELESTGRDGDLADRFFDLPNVDYLGTRPLSGVPDVVDTFDVGLVPYCLNRFTQASSPLKVYEYYAMGKATVSTRVPEIVDFDENILFVEEEQSYVEQIERALEISHDGDERQRRIQLAVQHTTQKRMECVLEAMGI